MSTFKPIVLKTTQASASLYPYGAHLTSWQVAGRERLFTSTTTALHSGAAIRGGVPIVFPQFAELGTLPKHGLVRTMLWQPIEVRADQAVLRLQDDDSTRALWPHAFVADFTVQLRGEALALTLSITNSGRQPFDFTAALHTYLRVHSIDEVAVTGLQGLHYRDKAAGSIDAQQTTDSLLIDSEVDRIYFSTTKPVTVNEAGQSSLQCSAEGFNDTVIWNPGATKAAQLADLEHDGFKHMLCVEAAVIGQPVTLDASKTWSGTQHLRVVS